MTAPTTSPPDDQFMSAGDMAARMRAFDGATSSVGPPSTWPHSLTTAVRIILGSPHPMFLWWGPELANFYNDGYAVMLGKRHPSALGRPAKQVWTEIWPDLAPLIESVLVRGEGTWREDFPLIVERNGYPEEAFFTFSYSPAPDDDGHIGGLFCAVTEETQRVLAERRLRTLRDLANAPAIHVAEACELALNTLDPRDVPFAATYLFEARGPRATCCARVGSGADALPAFVLSDEAGPWPFAEVASSRAAAYVEDARERLGDLAGGPWPEPCSTVAVVPIVQSGHDRLHGILVAGISPRRPLDEPYRDFLATVAASIGDSITGARAHELELALELAQGDAKDSEAHLRAALSASNTGTYRWDARTDVIERDAAFAALFGLRAGLGSTRDDYAARVHAGDRSRWLAALERAREGVDFDLEYRTVWPDGSVHWILDRATVVEDEQGAPASMTGVAHEITSQKRAQAITTLLSDFESVEQNVFTALVVAAEMLPLRSAILIEETAAGPTSTEWSTDERATGNDLDRSRRHARAAYDYLVGTTTSGLLVQPATTPLPGAVEPADRKRSIVLPLVVGRGSVFGALQLEGSAPFGRSDLVFANAFANQLAIALDRLRAWRREVTARERAEALTRKHEALVDNLDNAFVWEADAGTLRLSYVSARAEALLGYPRQEWLDEGDAWLQHVHAADQAEVRLTLQRAVAEGRDQRLDHRWVARDGRTLWFHTGVHLEDRAGEAPLLQGVSVDVTPAKAAEEQVREQLALTRAMSVENGRLFDEARRAARAREQVLAVVSHDLRTPLSTVLLNTEFVVKALSTGDEPQLRKGLERTYRSAKQMERLIADLLDVVSVQTGRLSIRRAPTDPTSLLSEAAASFEMSAQEAKLRLTVELEPSLPLVSCDRARGLQVLSNLIGNSLSVTPAGGVVTLRAAAHGREVRFSVSDTGPGIAPDQLSHLFERFWRGPEAGYAGTGLGLAISKGIVEAHGGRIWAESPPGKGATVTFALPVDDGVREAERAADDATVLRE